MRSDRLNSLSFTLYYPNTIGGTILHPSPGSPTRENARERLRSRLPTVTYLSVSLRRTTELHFTPAVFHLPDPLMIIIQSVIRVSYNRSRPNAKHYCSTTRKGCQSFMCDLHVQGFARQACSEALDCPLRSRACTISAPRVSRRGGGGGRRGLPVSRPRPCEIRSGGTAPPARRRSCRREGARGRRGTRMNHPPEPAGASRRAAAASAAPASRASRNSAAASAASAPWAAAVAACLPAWGFRVRGSLLPWPLRFHSRSSLSRLFVQLRLLHYPLCVLTCIICINAVGEKGQGEAERFC